MSGTSVAAGQRMPEVAGQTPAGPLDLADFRGKRGVVLWTYPMDDTPGCTIEAQEFSARKSDFAAAGMELVAVSTDDVDAHRAFAAKCGLTCHLLADPDGAIVRRLGVESAPGGRAKRTTFVIDVDGIVRRVFEDVKARGHADEVLEAVRAMTPANPS